MHLEYHERKLTMNMSQKRIVAVLGMHRSGTSAITRGLQVLGVDLGERLLQPQIGVNDKGFWEDGDVTEFNNEVLAALGREWDSLQPILSDELNQPHIETFKLRAVQLLRKKTANTTCFGLKDPRMPRLIPFWQDVFAHVGLSASYVIACRNPMNVAQSLAKRNGFPLEKGYLLWLEHMLCCLKQTQGQPRVFVDYDQMLNDPARQLARIAEKLDLPFVQDSPALAEYRQEFLQNGLRHNDFELADLLLDPAVPADALVLSNLIEELTTDTRRDDEALVEELDGLWGELKRQQVLYRLTQQYDRNSVQHLQTIKECEAHICALDLQGNTLTERNNHLEDVLRDYTAEVEKLRLELAHRHDRIQFFEREVERYDSPRFLLCALARQALSATGVQRLRQKYLSRQLIRNGLFEEDFYLSTYPDVQAAGIDPLTHYLNYGWREGRAPSPMFSTEAYLATYDDVRQSGVNPLVHYLRYGRQERRAIQTPNGDMIDLPVEPSYSTKLQLLLKQIAKQPDLIRKFFDMARRQGLRQALAIVAAKLKREMPALSRQANILASTSTDAEGELIYDLFKVVPYYLNPYLEMVPVTAQRDVAVHLHVSHEGMANECIAYLTNIPVEFDLFISVVEELDTVYAEELFRDAIPQLRRFTLEDVPNRGRDIAPFIIQFGERLSRYDVIGHFHTLKNSDGQEQSGTFQSLMGALCGSLSGVAQIFGLLGNDGKIVYPASREPSCEQAGWGEYLQIARDLLHRFGHFDVADFPSVEFPRDAMFWARSDSLREFLGLGLSFDDFPVEPVEGADTLANALVRLILIYSTPCTGRNYRLESPALSHEPQEFFEEQYDYSSDIVHDSIKVLAYYLPQFHPTPENDEWHGKGFTEWYKVSAANPLFQGHFQQHIPHDDVGYYHLDSPEQLSRQAEQMRQASVHGMIFYHYWFSGKLILEKPAQMLLANPQIDMPYSFCWANENWTRRWDGNEREILLGQVYSQDDARDFICYLMPFFKDERYIKVEGRPLLFVYRPSSMEYCGDYMTIWREECERSGVPAPYVVATLTRGAVEPQAYGMDAAVERVLHDWTDGAVPNIKDQLHPYWPMTGSVLDYSSVADHYMTKSLDTDYTLFRSLVPTWDNTARYGTGALALHAFNPRKMQEWMEHLIRYSEENLPADRRFVVVNAWNEWAEGAHLEPDTRFGYGYLNAIGRALCGHDFNDIDPLRLNPALRVAIELGDTAAQRLQREPVARHKFLRILANSGLQESYSLCTADAKLAAVLSEAGIECIEVVTTDCVSQADHTLVFSDLCLFPENTVETLLKMARRHQGFDISATLRNDPEYLHGPDIHNFEIPYARRSIMELRGQQPSKGFKACPQANCFVVGSTAESRASQPLEAVSTIIRFHSKGDRILLDGAILSLLAQSECSVQVCLALQDLDDDAVDCLQNELARLPWDEGCQPILCRYSSTPANPDLRAVMLNDGLKKIGSGYAAFLDYDDVLFPNAYFSLIERLKTTGKNATFGRVYSAMVDFDTGLILRRDRVYDSGFSYDEFVRCNHAPLHSFMFDLDRVDLSGLVWFDDMKYMEDYYLTLQVFSRYGTDWVSLRNELFIGDYVHRVGDSNHTLALTDDDSRDKLISTAEYQRCEQRIKALRNKLMA